MSDINQRLQEFMANAYERAPAVRQQLDDAGVSPADILTAADLDRIPILPKDKVIQLQAANPPFGGLLTVPMAAVRHIYFSPGPLFEPSSDNEPAVVAMCRNALEQTGFGAGDVVLNSFSYHLVPAGLLLDATLTEMGCTVVPGGIGNSELQLAMMQSLGVTGYTGTASFLMQLIEKAEAQGQDFKRDYKVTKAFVSAEPVPASLRDTLTETYGITLGNAYATAELGFMAINTSGGPTMQLLPEPIVQIVDPETGKSVGPGEAGEVVVTNLNPVYALVRFGTGDMALNIDMNPGASRQEERAIVLIGRSGEAAKVRGMFVHPNQLRFAVAQVAPGAVVQGIVRRPATRDEFVARIALAQGSDSPALSDRLKQAIHQSCRVQVDMLEFVPAGSIAADAPGMVDERVWD